MPQFYTLLTDTGQAKIANAVALGTQIEITQMAVGDGGGNPVTPDSSATTLVNEVRRAPINAVQTDDDNPTWIVIEQVLPPDVGGWTIREVGVFDAAGDLIAMGNLPETYKPVLAEGSSRTQTIRVVMEVSDTAAVTLKVDPSVVLATREYVDDEIEKHEQSRNHPAASETSKGMLKIANEEEALAGTDGVKAMTPKTVHAAFNKYGLGVDTLSQLNSTSEVDSATITGFYYVGGVSMPGENYGTLMVVSGRDIRTFQVFRPISSATETAKQYTRFSQDGGGTWSDWVKTFTEDDRADRQQAEDGVRSDLLMSPVRTRQAFIQYGLGDGAFKGTTDLDSLVEQGFYSVNGDTPGLPINANGAVTVGGQKIQPTQTFTASAENRTFIRSKYADGGSYDWTPWVETSTNYSGFVVFSSPGTSNWIVPDELKHGIKKARVTVVGAGGGGRAMQVYWGGGGGGGIAKGIIDLTGVNTVSVTVGLGGNGGTYSTTNGRGDNGGASSFGPFMSATGGGGGEGYGGGGPGGVGVGGDFNGSLGSGQSVGDNVAQNEYACGGSGGGPGGHGFLAKSDSRAGHGLWPGGGGGGGASYTSGPAGNGANGGVIIEW